MTAKTFGAFELVRELGSGSVARVYEARFKDKRVALKLFDSGKYRPERESVLRQFQNEAAAIRHLNHRNIVKVVDVGISDERPYIAMELMEKGSLENRLAVSADPLTVCQVNSILDPIADALDYAHGQHVLHRDIKPSNILFGGDDRPVLSDFGVARFVPPRDDAQTTQGGSDVPGTTDFLAPEVLEEAPHSRASDIYALGMTVYISLTTRLPSDGRTLFTRSRDRVVGDLVILAKRNPSVPKAVSDVVMRAIATSPTDRFASARAFSAAFSAAAAGVMVSNATATADEPIESDAAGRPPTTLREAAFGMFAGLPKRARVAVLVVALGGAGTWFVWNSLPDTSKERLIEGFGGSSIKISAWNVPRRSSSHRNYTIAAASLEITRTAVNLRLKTDPRNENEAVPWIGFVIATADGNELFRLSEFVERPSPFEDTFDITGRLAKAGLSIEELSNRGDLRLEILLPQ